MNRDDAFNWLRVQLVGPTSGQMARTLAERLAGPLVRLFASRKLLPYDPYDWYDRIDNYSRETGFPGSLFVAEDGRLVGTWILGNDYRVKSELYGGYPNTYLPRVRSLFRDKKRTLHLFSGSVDLEAFPGDTVDVSLARALAHPINTGMHYTDDAQTLTRVPVEDYDLVLADPPYSVEDAVHYETSMIKRNAVMRCLARLPSGAHIVWLDQVLPMWRKDTFALIGVVGIVRSTNHRFRIMSVYRRL